MRSPSPPSDEPGELSFEVTAAEAGVRVDRLVVEHFRRAGRHASRGDVQRWIADGRVLVGGRAVAKKVHLAEGDRVVVEPAPPLLSAATPDPSVHVPVVFEDEHLLVVDKPAGLVVHPARGHAGGTLVNGLLALPGFAADNADPRDETGRLRPGIVHRLDKDTSGLLVVAKSPRCREGLKDLFARHDIERSYVAIAVGAVARARFDTLHGRHPQSRLRFTSRLVRPDARRAITEVEPLRRSGGCTLVRCTLHTGRTHQIRVHLAEQAGAPILGDPLYGAAPADARVAAIASRLARQALHAEVLGFVHPLTQQPMRWKSPLPADLLQALASLDGLD
jgi:23S rRNA pseudouridine1911/1915/1917 synthase